MVSLIEKKIKKYHYNNSGNMLKIIHPSMMNLRVTSSRNKETK